MKKILNSKLFRVAFFSIQQVRSFLRSPALSPNEVPCEDGEYFLTIWFDDCTQKSVAVSAEEAQLHRDGKLDVSLMAERPSFFTKINLEDGGDTHGDGTIEVIDASPETIEGIVDFIHKKGGMDGEVP